MPKAEISWKRRTPEGGKLQVYVRHTGGRYRFFAREKCYDQWEPVEVPPLDDWLLLLESIERRVQHRLMKPEELDGTMRFQQSPRLFHLQEGLALWEDYTLQAIGLEQRFGANAMRVRYEDFLARPVQELARLATFAGLEPGTDQLQAAVTSVNPDRRCAFTRDNELVSVYRDYRERYSMKALGYDRLVEDDRHTAA